MIENTKRLKDKKPYNISEMSEKHLKEEEERLKINEIKLEELNEEIEYINKKIIRYNKKLEAINDDASKEFIEYLNMISNCYYSLGKNIYDKSCILKYITNGKAMIEVWKQNLKQSSQNET